jgi:hypothetical protein
MRGRILTRQVALTELKALVSVLSARLEADPDIEGLGIVERQTRNLAEAVRSEIRRRKKEEAAKIN